MYLNCIGWICFGDEEYNFCLVVVLINGDQGWKYMEVGEIYVGKMFVDYLGNCE